MALEAWSFGRGPPLFIQLQVVPGSLCSKPSIPGDTHFLVRGSISFLTRRKISSIASAILFNCAVSIIFLSKLILYYPAAAVKLEACSLQLIKIRPFNHRLNFPDPRSIGHCATYYVSKLTNGSGIRPATRYLTWYRHIRALALV